MESIDILYLTYIPFIKITPNTPKCVLTTIANAHGYVYKEKFLLRYLLDCQTKYNDNSQYYLSNIDFHSITLPEFARFVNNTINWKKNNLIIAYQYLKHLLESNDTLSVINTQTINFGMQTNELCYSLNPCILYKICLENLLPINKDTTMTEMETMVNILLKYSKFDNNKIQNIVSVKLNTDKDFKQKLIKLLIETHNNLSVSTNNLNNTITHDNLENMHNVLNNVKFLQSMINPTTNEGAIALVAINYRIDISKSCNVIEEFKLLKNNGIESYIPYDDNMKYWYNLNKNIYNLDKTYNPLFSPKYYDYQSIINMAITEGYSNEEIKNNDPYELMQLAYIADTFYDGRFPNIKKNETIYYLNIEDLEDGELICYGRIDEELFPITIEELIAGFKCYRNYTSPFRNGEVISKLAISKLKQILTHNTDNYKEEIITLRKELYNLILVIESEMKIEDEITKSLIHNYYSATMETKTAIHEMFTDMLEMGMYMRGWSGEGAFPIENAVYSVDEQEDVLIRVARSIAKYERQGKRLGKIGNQINNLPLIEYRDGQYLISTNKNQGYTIAERIEIIKDGKDSDNINSCIRISSNWICATAHKYMNILGLNPPFDIFNLRKIY